MIWPAVSFRVAQRSKYLVFDHDAAALRIMSDGRWLSEIGGMKMHYKAKRGNRILSVDLVRYATVRDGPMTDRDVIGRKQLWLDLQALLLMALIEDGIDRADLEGVFAYPQEARAAHNDLHRLGTLMANHCF